MKTFSFIAIVLLACTLSAQVSDFASIDFTKADNIAKLNDGRRLDNLPLLAHELTYKLKTDAEKFRAIYYWVCHNITGDSKLDVKVGRKQRKFKKDSLGFVDWNHSYKRTAFKKLLKHKKTVCTGYAYLIKELCFLVNIECKIVDGYGRNATANVEELETINHSWNAVKLNGKWYLCDATWSSGYNINGLFVKDFNEGYFLADPVLFSKNHFPIEKKWFLNHGVTEEEFVTSPLIYSEAFKYKLIPSSHKQMYFTAKKNEAVDFCFVVLDTLSTDKISLIKYDRAKEVPYKIHNRVHANGILSFNCKFEQRGYQDIHLKINDDIVASYSIHVSK